MHVPININAVRSLCLAFSYSEGCRALKLFSTIWMNVCSRCFSTKKKLYGRMIEVLMYIAGPSDPSCAPGFQTHTDHFVNPALFKTCCLSVDLFSQYDSTRTFGCDFWTGSNERGSDQQEACERSLPGGPMTIISAPPAGLDVDSTSSTDHFRLSADTMLATPLFDVQSGNCYKKTDPHSNTDSQCDGISDSTEIPSPSSIAGPSFQQNFVVRYEDEDEENAIDAGYGCRCYGINRVERMYLGGSLSR